MMIKYMATDAALREMLPGLDEMDPEAAASVRAELALRDVYAQIKTPEDIAVAVVAHALDARSARQVGDYSAAAEHSHKEAALRWVLGA